MNILFCSELPLRADLGAAKVLIELAEALGAQGHHCDHLTPDALGMSAPVTETGRVEYCERLAAHLATHARRYDVVDYGHAYLPFDRSRFPTDVLFVARSVLLVQHATRLEIPKPRGLRASLSRLVRGRERRRELDAVMQRADRTVLNADLVNVSNDDDRTELVARGVEPGRIVVLPFGLTTSRRARFDAVSAEPPERPVVAFVGTFDYRKGAPDFAAIFGHIRGAVPDSRLVLFGTQGLLRSVDEVLAFFPRQLRPHVQVHERFVPDDLPKLLSEASVGIFPSYYEGFGFGVLEMLAAAVPVVAYDAPGPPMMLERESLVAPGDTRAMANTVIALLGDRRRLAGARMAARRASQRFDWTGIARSTADVYRDRLCALRGDVRQVSAG